MRMRKPDKINESHPRIHSDLECGDGQGVGFDGGNQPVNKREIAHGRDGEVLEDDSEQPGRGEIKDEAGPDLLSEKRQAQRKNRKFGDDVGQGAASTAMKRGDGDLDQVS